MSSDDANTQGPVKAVYAVSNNESGRKGFSPDWVEKNSQPKQHYYPRPKRELTPWQKRGPMSRRDWVRFYRWAAKNAIPKGFIDKALEELNKEGEGPKKTKVIRKKPKISLEEIMERLVILGEPKHPRQKYEYPPIPQYPYSPKIHHNKPANHDRGRPFAPPPVPTVFQHEDLENEFWTTIRFPIVRSALNYIPTSNVIKLAEPRETPPKIPHCPIPERPVESIMPRQRLSSRRWREHLRRLQYLSKPIYRPNVHYRNL